MQILATASLLINSTLLPVNNYATIKSDLSFLASSPRVQLIYLYLCLRVATKSKFASIILTPMRTR